MSIDIFLAVYLLSRLLLLDYWLVLLLSNLCLVSLLYRLLFYNLLCSLGYALLPPRVIRRKDKLSGAKRQIIYLDHKCNILCLICNISILIFHIPYMKFSYTYMIFSYSSFLSSRFSNGSAAIKLFLRTLTLLLAFHRIHNSSYLLRD